MSISQGDYLVILPGFDAWASENHRLSFGAKAGKTVCCAHILSPDECICVSNDFSVNGPIPTRFLDHVNEDDFLRGTKDLQQGGK